MGRASFGGAADYSGVFAGLYNQAASERKQQIDNAMNEAKRVAQAEDEDMIDRWKKGLVSDNDLLGRLAMRRDEAMDDVDKSAFASLYDEYKELIADDKAAVKYKDNPGALAAYYEKKAKGLNPNSAGYRRAMLEAYRLKKLVTPSNDGRKNDPATLAKIDAFVNDETDYKLLVIKAYEGGMSTWPPSTSNGLTQAEVDILIEGASDYDVPTGGEITPDYIDGLDKEIIAAIDLAVVGAPSGSKSKYTALKAKYLADHVTLHNDYEQASLLTGDDGILQTQLTGLSDYAKTITDPADYAIKMKEIRDTIAAHFKAAADTGATTDNTSGGATSNEYQILGDKIVAIVDDIIAGKTTYAQASTLLSATVKGFPDYKDNWVGSYFTDETIKSMFGDGSSATVFTRMNYYAAGYKAATAVPPTKAFAYDSTDGGFFVDTRKVTKVVGGKTVTTYEPVLPVPEANADGTTSAWTNIVMDVNGVPTLVPALATQKTDGLPMSVYNKQGVRLTSSGDIEKFYKEVGKDIVNYMKPNQLVYEVTVGGKAYSYVGGTIGAKGTLTGGTWVPSSKLTEIYEPGGQFTFSDKTLADLMKNGGLRYADEKPYVKIGGVGEPMPYFGDHGTAWRNILGGKDLSPSALAILEEAGRHGIGFDGNGGIDPYDPAQSKIWEDIYKDTVGSDRPIIRGGGGPAGFTRSDAQVDKNLGNEDKWNAASEAKALYHYGKDYIAYGGNPEAPRPKQNDPIAQILGEEEGDIEQGLRYAPRVGGQQFGPSGLSEYSAMARERDKSALPKITLSDSWDRGLATTPKPPSSVGVTPPAPPASTPPPAPTPPSTPSNPRPPAGPRPI